MGKEGKIQGPPFFKEHGGDERAKRLQEIDQQLGELSDGGWLNPRRRSERLHSVQLSIKFEDKRMSIPEREIERMERELIAISEGPVWDEWKRRVVDMRCKTEDNKPPLIQQLPREITSLGYKDSEFGRDPWRPIEIKVPFTLVNVAEAWKAARFVDPQLPGFDLRYDRSAASEQTESGVLRAYSGGNLAGSRGLKDKRIAFQQEKIGPDGKVDDNILFAMFFDYLQRGNTRSAESLIGINVNDPIGGKLALAGLSELHFRFDGFDYKSSGIGASIGINRNGFVATNAGEFTKF